MMQISNGWVLALVLVLIAGCEAAPDRAGRGGAEGGPPDVPREFRGVWVATVANIDWPSKPGLSSEEQKAELIAILDKSAELNLNAVVFQVRPAGDALYASEIEPWSEYLTGEQGRDPGYDPLAFAIEEAHARGLELHAWFNPYRVWHPSAKGEPAEDHISKTRPDIVRQYGKMLWLDPAEPDAADLTLRVMLDVVRRYDIDGVHIDDYFYPYPVREDGERVDFPDEGPWQAYQARGGKLSRGDWRREQVNRLVKRIYQGIKREKRHVKFGISPFGIWKPGYPEHVRGMNQYETIYADAKLWFEEGWCDYFTPQLYWTIRNPDQSFISLMSWWQEQNEENRHLWPGLFTSKTHEGSARQFDEQEIRHQVEWTRILEPETPGHVHFSMKALMEDRGGIAETLKEEVYQRPALIPPSPWLARGRGPATPRARLVEKAGEWAVELQREPSQGVQTLVVQAKRGDRWSYRLHPAVGDVRTLALPAGEGAPTAVVVFAVDRNGMASRRVTLVGPGATRTASLGR